MINLQNDILTEVNMWKTIITFILNFILLTVSTAFTPSQADVPGNGPPLSLTLILLGFCCIILLIIGVIVLGVVVRKQNQKDDGDG
jgi:hypothetical protein